MTTSIWADVVENIVGDDANVQTIIPIGADAHDFAPSSQDVAAIQTADLVVANGLGLEEGLEDVLEAAEADGVNVLEVAPLVNPIPFALADEHDHDEEGDHEHDDEGEHSDEKDEDHSDEEHSDEEGDHEHDDEGEHSDDESISSTTTKSTPTTRKAITRTKSTPTRSTLTKSTLMRSTRTRTVTTTSRT